MSGDMYIYELVRLDSVGYDEYDSFIVVAGSATEARQVAAEADTRCSSWRKAKTSKVQKLGVSTRYRRPVMVLGSFNAG